jgi:AcrR family transcriptional regulator
MQRQQARERILNTAYELFTQRGFDMSGLTR